MKIHDSLGLAVLLALPVAALAQFSYTNNNGTITITGYTGTEVAVTIPDIINGLPVTAIGVAAFINQSNLTTVVIPDSVTSIGADAFENCTGLLGITLPKNLSSIEYGTFYQCFQLTDITVPNAVTNIGDFAFYSCFSLTKITIPDKVRSIGSWVFQYCWRLSTVTIGRGVTNIGFAAFSSCSGLLAAYFIGNTPSVDGSYTFDSDNGLTIYYFPGTTGWGPSFWGHRAVLWNPMLIPTRFGAGTNGFGFTIAGSGDFTVAVEACTNLAEPHWIPVATNTLAWGSSFFSDPAWSNFPARFYRLTRMAVS